MLQIAEDINCISCQTSDLLRLWISTVSSPWNALEALRDNHCFWSRVWGCTTCSIKTMQNWLGLFLCCCRSMLDFPFLSSDKALLKVVREGAGITFRLLWASCRVFLVAQELSSCTSKCDGEDNWLKFNSLIAFWTSPKKYVLQGDKFCSQTSTLFQKS